MEKNPPTRFGLRVTVRKPTGHLGHEAEEGASLDLKEM